MDFEPEAFSEDMEDFCGAIAEDAVCGSAYEDDCPLDGDAESALASVGWGTDEDYGCYEGDPYEAW